MQARRGGSKESQCRQKVRDALATAMAAGEIVVVMHGCVSAECWVVRLNEMVYGLGSLVRGLVHLHVATLGVGAGGTLPITAIHGGRTL
jgi:hypothetical protein